MISRTREYVSPYAVTILRIVIGLIFLLMGLGKFQNAAGAIGFPAGFITTVGSLGFPVPGLLAWLPLILEPIGGLLLVLGIGTRWLAAYFFLEMVITTIFVKALRGTLFIQPRGAGVGYELDLLLAAGCLVLAAMGSTHISIEKNVLKREL